MPPVNDASYQARIVRMEFHPIPPCQSADDQMALVQSKRALPGELLRIHGGIFSAPSQLHAIHAHPGGIGELDQKTRLRMPRLGETALSR